MLTCEWGLEEQLRPELARQDKTRYHTDTTRGGTTTRSTRDSGTWVGEGHPGVGEVYHLSLLCGEAWMDSSCQTSIYQAAWRNSPPHRECTLSPQLPLLTALPHWWTSPAKNKVRWKGLNRTQTSGVLKIFRSIVKYWYWNRYSLSLLWLIRFHHYIAHPLTMNRDFITEAIELMLIITDFCGPSRLERVRNLFWKYFALFILKLEISV